jgi:glutaredoxin
MKEKINVYLFWGLGCPHCEAAKLIFKKLLRDNGDYFNLVEKEVWNDIENEELMNKVADKLNVPAETVPYIVIGNKVFGVLYDKKVQEDVISTIKDAYNNPNYEDVIASI